MQLESPAESARDPGMSPELEGTVGGLVRWLMPRGTNPESGSVEGWGECPCWPPDVFAVAATLVERSGSYALPGIVISRTARESEEKGRRAETAAVRGREWGSGWGWTEPARVPVGVREDWARLVAAFDEPLVSTDSRPREWHRAAIALLASADEACAGLGFLPGKAATAGDLTVAAMDQFFIPALCNELPASRAHSLAVGVDADKVCVLPKALTPVTGCTTRSLSHHLALLPGRGQVASHWIVSSDDPGKAPEGPLNLLVVPFPYRVLASDFVKGGSPVLPSAGYFGIEQGWLEAGEGMRDAVEGLERLVGDLIREVEREGRTVHEIVFPEAALTTPVLEALGKRLARRHRGLERIMAGTLDRVGTGSGARLRNAASIVELRNGSLIAHFAQRKHHRWRLDRGQIETYGLGDRLDPAIPWWEEIDVESREIYFALNRRNWVQAVLVCEDLARTDPVLPVVHAVGPNLVLALLLDGPQLVHRWPARYATVLADDPGSAVLSVTALGMVERSRPPGVTVRRVVGLWKDSFRGAVELELPLDAQALLLSIGSDDRVQWTMDRRTDGGTATHLKLLDVRPVGIGGLSPWLMRLGNAGGGRDGAGGRRTVGRRGRRRS